MRHENKSTQDNIKTPVVLIIFNRADTTRLVLDAIRKYAPDKLFIIADGPRQNVASDASACRSTRSVVSAIDWNCDVKRIYSEKNMGSRARIQSGLDEVFQQVDSAIILEDDCLPDESFFTFTSEMLNRYRATQGVGMISGNSYQPQIRQKSSKHYFSSLPHIWGWATWASRWEKYEKNAESWNRAEKDSLLAKVFFYKVYRTAWKRTLDSIATVDAWDYQWAYSLWAQNMYSVVPGVNLVQNIGLNELGTNTLSESSHFQNKRGRYIAPKRVKSQSIRRSIFRDFLELSVFRIFAARHMSVEDWLTKIKSTALRP